MQDLDRELMREKDRLSISASKIAIITGIITIITIIVGIFVAIYVRPIEAKITAHILKNEPETAVLILKVNTLETQFTEIIKKLERIEILVNNRRGESNGR